MKKAITLLLAVLMVLSMLAACSPSSADTSDKTAQTTDETSAATTESAAVETSNAATEPYVIGVDLFYKSDEYYLDIEVCLKQKAEELGLELDIQNADTDLATQVQQVEDFITEGVDAILISAVDPTGSYACVEAANQAGIPIFMFDGVTENTTGVVAYSKGDYEGEGVQAGEWAKAYIEENLGGTANYAVLDYFPSTIICGGRANGFMSVLDAMDGVTCVSHQDGGATREGGMSVMEDILTSNENDVDLVFAINYESGAGAASAIEAIGTDTVVVCVAWNSEGFQKLENNDPIMKAYLIPEPPQEIATMLDAVVKYLNGEEIDQAVMMGSAVYDSSNISQLDWKSIVAARDE